LPTQIVADARPLLDPAVKRPKKVVEIFLRDVPKNIESIRAALVERASERLGAEAHRLRGGCSVFGADRMSHTSAELVLASRQADYGAAAPLLARLEAEFAEVKRLLS
jgi:HPt (histidine-containing phosphotransfer) domain-containing protein